MKKATGRDRTVPSSEYTEEYYHSACGGFREFKDFKGVIVHKRFRIPLELAGIRPGDHILDVGCGRGEILYQSAKVGASAFGFDYSTAALKIASDNLKEIAPDLIPRIGLHIGNAKRIPIKSDSMDVVFMLDVVEHLYPPELFEAYDEIFRILKTGGRLIIHTTPSLWYYHFGYPLYRLLRISRGVRLPKNPRDRFPFSHVHVNEQTPFSLFRGLKRKGFRPRVWLTSTQDYDRYEVSQIMRAGMKLLTRAFPFRYIFCDDIFAVAIKTSEKINSIGIDH